MSYSLPTPPPLNIVFFANYDVTHIGEEARSACYEADLVIALGGLDLQELADIVPPNKPALCSVGPQDTRQVPPPFRALHASGFQFRDWRLAGFSGSPRRGRGEGLYYSETEAVSLLEDLPAADLFLSHSPPAGLSQSGGQSERGFMALADYVQEKPPIYHFYSHPTHNIDEQVGETMFIGVNGMLFPPPLEFG